MKRTLLSITEKMTRNMGHTNLTPKDLNHPDYWIFEAIGWRLQDVLREVEYRVSQDRIKIYLNTQHITSKDCIVEQSDSGLVVKFKKLNFEMYTINGQGLDGGDYIEIKGDIEQYA
jgi:hypothetical protein